MDKAIAEADVVVEAEFRTQTVLHSSIETHQSDLRVARRLARHLHLDPVHLGRARRGRVEARPSARQGARRLRVHGRRLRLEERRGRPHVHRRRARQAHGSPGALHAHSPGGEPRGRQPQLDDPAADRRRALGRDARRAGRRVRERNGLGRLGGADRRPDADALRLRERPHGALARQDQHAPDEGVPRAGLRRGDVRARMHPRRARGQAGQGSARDPEAELRALGRRPAVFVEEPDGVLQARRAALAAARRGAGAQQQARGRTASASPARSGTAAAARPPTPGCVSAPTGARRS